MNSDIEHVLRSLPVAKAPAYLSGSITRSIIELQWQRARVRVVSALATSVGCIVALVTTTRLTLESASSSGLATYLALVLSDTRTVVSSWYEFLQLIAETTPFTEISIATAILFALIISLRTLSQNTRIALHTLTLRSAQ